MVSLPTGYGAIADGKVSASTDPQSSSSTVNEHNPNNLLQGPGQVDSSNATMLGTTITITATTINITTTQQHG